MTIFIDVSQAELLPEPVLRFVLEHGVSRPPENILFKVSKEVHDLHRARTPVAVVVSQEEADEINAFLDSDWSPDDFTMTSRESCTNCDRTLTFYDVFESGRARHGDAFMRRFLAGEEYHIQVAAKDEGIEIDCMNCKTVNVMVPEGGTKHYSGSGYTYV